MAQGPDGVTLWLVPGDTLTLRRDPSATGSWRALVEIAEGDAVRLWPSVSPAWRADQPTLGRLALPPDVPTPSVGGLTLTGPDGAQRRWPVRWVANPRGDAPLDPLTERLWAPLTEARTAAREGRLDDALEAWRRGAAAADEAGLVSESIRRRLAAAHMALDHHRYPLAESLIEAIWPRLNALKADLPLSAWDARHTRGYLRWLTGRLDEALTDLQQAVAGYAALGAVDRALASAEALALLQSDLGRHHEARATLAATGEPTSPWAKASLQTNAAWIELRGAVEGHWPLAPADLRRRFTAALEIAKSLGAQGMIANLEANLAFTALAGGDAPEARRRLAAAEAADPEGQGFAALFTARLAGEIALASDPAAAADAFAEAEARARRAGGGDCEDCWRAAWGRGRAAAALGDAEAALGHLRRAWAEVQRLSRYTSITADRGRFQSDRRRLLDDALDALLQGGCRQGPCLHEILGVVDSAWALSLRDLYAQARLQRLDTAARGRWHEALARARAAAEAVRASAARGPLVPSDALGQWQIAHAGLKAERDQAFEAAFEILDAHDDAVPSTLDVAALQRALAPGEALVAFSRHRDRWLSFWLSPEEVALRPLTGADPLGPWRDKLTHIGHLYVVHGGHPRAFDVATATFESRGPLLLSKTVSYLPAARLLSLLTDPATPGSPLIIADPRGDLAGAAAEGAQVAGLLQAPGAALLTGAEATAEAALPRLSGAGLVHFAGHGVLRRRAPWETHLALHDTDRLTLYDILSHPTDARLIFLSGCETGVDEISLDEALVGLPEAFLAAGARSVVATARPVHDRSALAFVRHFYRALAEGQRPADALRVAAMALHAQGDPHWDAFRLMGRR